LDFYGDLLKFPLAVVRKDAVGSIINMISAGGVQSELLRGLSQEELRILFEFLGSEGNKLNRTQVVALLALLSGPKAALAPLSATWIGLAPDPQSVAEVLAAISRSEKAMPFSVEAARYLKNKEWSLNLSSLERLGHAADPLVRTIAYTKISISSDPQGAELLRGFLQKESNPRIKKQLEEIINSGRE
jgi:hypothetical protein